MIGNRVIPGRAPFGGRGLPDGQGRMGVRPGPIQRPIQPLAYEPLAGLPGVVRPGFPVTKMGVPVRPILGSMKKGGKVKKTGVYKLHAGETVMAAGDCESHEYDFRKHQGGRKKNG